MELSWQEFAQASPELAAFGEARFREGIAFLATVRPDGSPRVHPIIADLIDGHLVVFMEPTSPKARDLLREPRYSLHAHVAPYATNGEFVCWGKAKSVVGDMRVELGLKAPNMQDRYVLSEFFLSRAL